jgi:hypothetical protein
MYEDVSYLLYDGQGKLVLSDDLSGTLTQIQVNQLAPGAYSLCINDQTGQLKNFKLIKSH